MRKTKNKTIHVTVSMTEGEKEKAQKISKEIFGEPNLSGLIRFWIHQYKKQKHDNI